MEEHKSQYEEDGLGIVFSLKYLLLNAITGQLEENEQIENILKSRYEMEKKEKLAVFGVGLREDYCKAAEVVNIMLEDISSRNQTFRSFVVSFPYKQAFLMVIYKIDDLEEMRTYFERKVVPMLCGKIRETLICTWGTCEGIWGIRDVMLEMSKNVEWNLIFGRGVLISQSKIEEAEVLPIRYPIDLEKKTREAFVEVNSEQFQHNLDLFRDYCINTPCSPGEIKEACVRYFLTAISVAKELGHLNKAYQAKDAIFAIIEAITWEEIERVAWACFEQMLSDMQKDEDEVSLLVRKAQRYIREYYNQGITLEEIAVRLHVTEEYLSTRFKKETGKSFTETIRKFRIEKIKELLRMSTLKLNQIADIVGYSDPKYMSKVFKEEVGILPSEYRKQKN